MPISIINNDITSNIAFNRWKHTNTHTDTHPYPLNPFPFSCSATRSTLCITMATASWQQLEESQFLSSSHSVSPRPRSSNVSNSPAAYYGLAKWWVGGFNTSFFFNRHHLSAVACLQDGFFLLFIFIWGFLAPSFIISTSILIHFLSLLSAVQCHLNMIYICVTHWNTCRCGLREIKRWQRI